MTRLLVIGAGPSGMSVLYHFERLNQAGELPAGLDVVCVEKQDDWGGLWNYTWATGVDRRGEYVHGSMYRYLWSNGPKEASLEYPDYSFRDHFGRDIPSFPPRDVVFDYLKGRWSRQNLRRYIRFGCVVRNVSYDAARRQFDVTSKRLAEDKHVTEQFDFIINCTGHFSVPHWPDEVAGIGAFPGRILHAHDFRDAAQFAGQRVLLVGSSYSAEDLALQVVKYGAAHVIICFRNKPMAYKWPAEIEERHGLKSFDSDGRVHFADGTSAEVDAVIMCTGYQHCYPHLTDDGMRLMGPNILYPDNLYKGTLWIGGDGDSDSKSDGSTLPYGGRLMYVGAQDQYYTMTMFDVQALWAVKVVAGLIEVPKSIGEMRADIKVWMDKEKKCQTSADNVDFQSDFVNDLVEATGYGFHLDIGPIYHAWLQQKKDNILTYRDQSHTSIVTGARSPIHHTTFMAAMDDSMATYLGTTDGDAKQR